MRRTENYLTKDQVSSATSEVAIIQHIVTDFDPKQKKNYKSPFTDKDDKPSLSFYKTGDHWYFKSHNSGHGGDVFQFWADYYNLDVKNEFPKVLSSICTALQLQHFEKKKLLPDYEAVYKPYSATFLKFWRQFKVDKATLEKYNVKQLISIKFKNNAGKDCFFDYQQKKQLVVGYLNKSRIKTYIPALEADFDPENSYQAQVKTFGYKNQKATDIFGLAQLPETEVNFIIIAAGEKDCLSLNSNGFHAISFQSENHMPNPELIADLRKKCSILYCCYDNDEAGQNFTKKLNISFGIIPISLPRDFKDCADFFKENAAPSFQELVDRANKEKAKENTQRNNDQVANTLFDRVEAYLSSKYKLRFDTIKKVYELSLIDEMKYKEVNENNLFVELNKASIKISPNYLKAFLKTDFCQPYNPIESYFNELPTWEENDPDYISLLANHVEAEHQEEFNDHFKKWLVRAVKCALENGYYNKHALILVHSQQNSGKSSFCRYLCPSVLHEYITENIVPGNKDSLIALASNFIINLDELKQFSAADINTLKAWISQDKVNVRLPYASKATMEQRVCSFVGSTNEGEFLKDHTGSVRWLCFKIRSINHDYHNYLTGVKNINIDDVWAQAYALYKSNYKSELTAEEIEFNEVRNRQFQQMSPEMELIPEYCKKADETTGEFMTSTEILKYIQRWNPEIKINAIMIGKALAFHHFKRVMSNKNRVYGYWINKVKEPLAEPF